MIRIYKYLSINLLKIGHIARKFLWGGVWLIGGSLMLWYPLRWWPGDRLLPVRLLNYFMPWLLVVLFPSLLVTMLTSRKKLTFVLTAPTIGISLSLVPQFISSTAMPVLADNRPLKVMSYNVLYKNEDVPAIAAVIRAEQPDIILLQEFIKPMIPAFNDELGTLYPNQTAHVIYEPAISQAMISRYPLTSIDADWLGRIQKVQVDTPNSSIQVWNIHSTTALKQYKWQHQQKELANIAQEVAEFNDPLILGGDFNTTPQSDNYQLIAQYLHNSHDQAGWGLGFSYPAKEFVLSNYTINWQWQLLTQRPVKKLFKWAGITRTPIGINYKYIPISDRPLVRIDHIFYNDHFIATQATTLKNGGGSDHLPIMAELHLRRD
ncbi:endonuclease/exonuclease/phosphatase family protein [Anaerolineales bacterium HSG25]|nr:endonuclease/exonuclease/phosphatase family protein [Anaerolineales bacterium HSG25]